jgi:nitrite reductase (NADH) large subunit
MTDEDGGQFATAKLKQKTGIDVRLKTTVDGIVSEHGQLTGVRFSEGDSLKTALLIVAIGVTPNSEPLTAEDRGVAVSAQMLADPSIYCAGDVAVTPHLVDGRDGIYATYPNAMLQARTAARHLMHGNSVYPGSINTNVLKKHIDFPIVSAGSFSGEAVTWEQGDIWRRVYLKEGKINGYIIIGDTRMSGYVYQLYRSQKRVDRSIKAILTAPRHDSYYREMLGVRDCGSSFFRTRDLAVEVGFAV